MSGGLFPESIVKDVIPYIEKNYRVIRNKDGRAFADSALCVCQAYCGVTTFRMMMLRRASSRMNSSYSGP
jgi:hypothetical protein